MSKSKAYLGSAIVLYFAICFEILIMISPFAGFFYSAFSPFLVGLAKYPATSWLSAFFFTHMVIPPNDFLKLIRVLGSVLFSAGIVVFLICALQVYSSKLLRRGPVIKGLYSFIRHPQYLALATAGAGLAILWPRFLVVVLWLAMVFVYYLLAKDEERRMQQQHPAAYRDYMERTGMFLPRKIDNAVSLTTGVRRLAAFVVLAILVVGGAFALRQYTVEHLPLWTDSKVVVLAVLAEDEPMMEHRMSDVLNLDPIKSRLAANQPYLVYFLPRNYVMQGLIADTGDDWQLYKRHHTISRFGDWIFHPFTHLGGAHASAFEPEGHSHHGGAEGTVRRLIFVKISSAAVTKPADSFQSVRPGRRISWSMSMYIHSRFSAQRICRSRLPGERYLPRRFSLKTRSWRLLRGGSPSAMMCAPA
jgi:protein-S-isoprenylcysteine O-methyltransferase Ste14